jgi:hypothetical protein
MATYTHREHSLDAIATAEACLHNDGETPTVLLDHAGNRACACIPRERAGGSKRRAAKLKAAASGRHAPPTRPGGLDE